MCDLCGCGVRTEQELELKEVKEVVRCFLHTILFNRALGTIKPKEVECDPPFDITYVRVRS